MNKEINTLINKIEGIYKECNSIGWDGYNASPIKIYTIEECIRFINLLPEEIPLPDPCPEPDGCIELEWYVACKSVFILSFSGDGKILCTGYLNKGTENTIIIKDIYEFKNSIPQGIINIIETNFKKE